MQNHVIGFTRKEMTGLVVSMIFLLTLCLGIPQAFAAAHPEGHQNSAVDRPLWLDKLENQVNYEEMMEGREGNQERLNKTWTGLMDRLKGKLMEHATPASSGGVFHNSWAGHQLQQGYLLGPTEAGSQVFKGAHCPAGVPTKTFDISAINVEITLNQWGDYFPGYMFVLNKDIDKVRDEEKRNKKAREDELDPGAVSTGIQGDAIQPLSIRGNQGDCVRVNFTNRLEDEDAGFQIHGSAMIISSTGAPGSAASKGGIQSSGQSQTFEWFIPIDEQEGTHLIVSHAGRDPQALGLIGAFIVEPRGSTYLDPWTGGPLENGWMAMIANDNRKDFREFTCFTMKWATSRSVP